MKSSILPSLLSGVVLSLRSISRSAYAVGARPWRPAPDPFDFAQGRLFGSDVPQDDAAGFTYLLSQVTRYTTPAESSLTYNAPSGPTTKPTGLPIHTPLRVSPGRSHPVMKSCGGPCGWPLSSIFMRTTL